MKINMLTTFAVVPVDVLIDGKLSNTAKGIAAQICHLSSVIKDKHTIKKEVMSICKTKEDILACMELHREGYINFTLP
jgi:NADH:ubiquinone oxidoreductase subunit B-like Fe-S oxidoreductase